jgi:acetoin utilization protein AcuB
MSSPVVVIHPQASLFEAYNRMFEHDIRRMPVIDRQGTLVGIITMSDIQQAVPMASHDESDRSTRLLVRDNTVEEIMTSAPITVAADDSVQVAAERMLEYQISGLPVIDGGKIVGMITESDIFRLVVESWADIENGSFGADTASKVLRVETPSATLH